MGVSESSLVRGRLPDARNVASLADSLQQWTRGYGRTRGRFCLRLL